MPDTTHSGTPRRPDSNSSNGRGFARNVGTLAAGSAAAQCLTLAACPVLTRLYSPADFGLLAVFVALMTPLSVLSVWKYDAALVVERDPVRALNLLAVTLASGVITSLAAIAGALLGTICLADTLGVPTLKWYGWLLPLAVLVVTLFNAFTSWSLRHKDFASVAKTRMGRSALRSAIQCGWGLLAGTPFGLFLGETAGQGGGALALARMLWHSERERFKEISLRRMWSVAKEHARFPLLSLPTSLISVLSVSVPGILLPFLYGQTAGGLFLMSQRLAAAPLTLFGSAVSQAYYAELSSRVADHRGNLRRFRKLSLRLALLAVAVGVAILSTPLWLSAVLGAKWESVSGLMLFTCPLLAAQIVVTPLAPTYTACGKHSRYLFVESLRLGIAVAVFVVCPLLGLTVQITVLIWSLTVALVYVLHWVWIHAILRDRALSDAADYVRDPGGAAGRQQALAGMHAYSGPPSKAEACRP